MNKIDQALITAMNTMILGIMQNPVCASVISQAMTIPHEDTSNSLLLKLIA